MSVLCRVCGKNEALSENNACSAAKCQEELSQARSKAAWYDLELQECQASLLELESGRYTRTYARLYRVECLVKVLSLGMNILKTRFKKPRGKDVRQDLLERQKAQYQFDRETAQEVRGPLKRLKRKQRSLSAELSKLDKDWEELMFKRRFCERQLKDALKVLGE